MNMVALLDYRMQHDHREKWTNRLCRATVPIIFLVALSFAGAAGAQRLTDPLRFFEGRTENVSTIKVIFKKSYRSKSVGRGEIRSDGTLHLVERVEEDGRPAFERRWHIRQIAPGRYSGTMSEAKGAVTVDEIAGRFRFRFRTKDNLSIEQWLTPDANGKSARSEVTIRKLGLSVASAEGTVRKVD